MSNTAFNFLSESVLFKGIGNNYKNVSLSELEKEIIDYKEHIKNNLNKIEKECNNSEGELNLIAPVKPINTTPTNEEILRGSLFLNKYLIDDPVFALDFDADIINNDRQQRGFTPYTEEDLKLQILERAKYMNDLTPSVIYDVGFIKFYPLSKDMIERNLSSINIPNLSLEGIEDEVLKWFASNVIVDEITRGNVLSKITKPCSHIGIRFKRDDSNLFMAMYQEILPIEYDEGTGKITFIRNRTIPGPREFSNWIQQEIIKTIKDKINHVSYNYKISKKFNAPLTIKSEFEKDFLMKQFKYDKERSVDKLGFQIDIPGFVNTNLEKSMDARRYCYDYFQNFRSQLYQDSLLISNATTEEELKKILLDIEKKYQYELEKIRQQMNKINIDFNTIFSFSLAILTYFTLPNPYSNLITGISLVQALHNISFDGVAKENPLIFLAKL